MARPTLVALGTVTLLLLSGCAFRLGDFPCSSGRQRFFEERAKCVGDKLDDYALHLYDTTWHRNLTSNTLYGQFKVKSLVATTLQLSEVSVSGPSTHEIISFDRVPLAANAVKIFNYTVQIPERSRATYADGAYLRFSVSNYSGDVLDKDLSFENQCLRFNGEKVFEDPRPECGLDATYDGNLNAYKFTTFGTNWEKFPSWQDKQFWSYYCKPCYP